MGNIDTDLQIPELQRGGGINELKTTEVSHNLSFQSDARLDFTSATVLAANTDGGVIKAGTSAAPVTEDTADLTFVKWFWDNGATSGDNRGVYNRLYITGAAGGGESFRTFTTVNNVAGGTAHGAHISLSFGTTGSLTGLGVAMRGTLHIANQAYTGLGGTYAAVQAEIWSDGATSDPAGMTKLSFIRIVNGGNASGIADVDDDAFLMEITGGSSGTGNLVFASTIKLDVLGSTRYFILSTAEDSLTAPASDFRIDLSSCTVAAANTDGGVFKAGTSSSPVTEDTADLTFMKMFWDNGATSGDNRGIYNRLYLTGAAGGGESLRSFTTVNNVAAGTAHGAHLSLSFGTTGSLTGLGVATRSTLHLPNQAWAGPGGTVAAIQPEIWADGANTDPAGLTELSLIRCVLGGNGAGADTGGVADIDDDGYLLVLDGGTINSGNIVATSTTETNYSHSARCKVNGTVMYLMFASAAG